MSKLVKNHQVIKTNQSLVHIKHNITIRQYKYWHLILKFFAEKIEQGIQPDENGFYFESRSKFADYIGYEQMTKELKTDIEALRKEPIIINYLEKDGKPAIHGMGFISEYKVSSNQIGYRLPSFLEKVIKGDDESRKMFLLLNWDVFNSFSGKYEAIIYKLCMDYMGVGRTPYLTIEEYREYIGLKRNEYPQFFRLNEWTIKKPIESINSSENCDITVGVELNKVGRTVAGLFFTVTHKIQANLPFEEFSPSTAFAQTKVLISPAHQAKYLEMYSEPQINAIIQRANEYAEQLQAKGKTANLGAIYNKAFSENWGEPKLEDIHAEGGTQKLPKKNAKIGGALSWNTPENSMFKVLKSKCNELDKATIEALANDEEKDLSGVLNSMMMKFAKADSFTLEEISLTG